MADEFKEGDIVQLKSGGPKMTIDNIGTFNKKPMAKCVWFNEKFEHKSETFSLEALMPM